MDNGLPDIVPMRARRYEPIPVDKVKVIKARVIEYIQRRQQEGKAMNYATLRGDDYALLGAAERYFGSWRNALLAAGIVLEKPGK